MHMSALEDVPRFQAGPAGLEALARILQREPGETTTPGAAFQAIALSCLHRFETNRGALARSGEAEALHQARVALRQLRSAFSIFSEIVADDRFEHLGSELRWLAAATNKARDLDALVARMDDVPASLELERRRASALASKVLASARSERLLREMLDWLANGVWLDVRNPRDQTAAEFASAALDRLRDKLRRKGRHLRSLDDDALHQVRIAAKKLRYAAWFFSGLFHADTAERRARRFIEAMRALQDSLGEIQDQAVAPALLRRLEIPRASWPRLPGRGKLVKRAAKEFEQALDRKPYWR